MCASLIRHDAFKRLTLPSMLLVGAASGFFLTDRAGATPDLNALTFEPVRLAETISSSPASPRGQLTFIMMHDDLDPALHPNSVSADIAQYQERLSALEQEDSPYQPAIAETALALGQLLASRQQYTEALVAYEKAQHVHKVNLGLYALDQIPAVTGMLDAHLRMGNIRRADEMHEFLYYLHRKNHEKGSPEMIKAMIDWADWNVNVFLEFSAYSPAGLQYAISGQFGSESPADRERKQRLGTAQELYYQVIQFMTEQGDFEDPRLVTTERKLAALNFIVNQEIMDHRGRIAALADHRLEQANFTHFQHGSSALRRAIDYTHQSRNPKSGDIGERMMELGDWYMLFDRKNSALEMYEEAFTVMAASTMSNAAIDKVMTPGMPVKAPDIEMRQNARASSGPYRGFIDVEFDVSKYGIASNPEIIGASSSEHLDTLGKELFKTIRSCKFRPRIVAGTPTDERVRLRYFYRY